MTNPPQDRPINPVPGFQHPYPGPQPMESLSTDQRTWTQPAVNGIKPPTKQRRWIGWTIAFVIGFIIVTLLAAAARPNQTADNPPQAHYAVEKVYR